MKEKTFVMIKPDATSRSLNGAILQRLESEGLTLVEGRLTRLSLAKAKAFYGEHKERPFFADLINFIQSGPVFVMALEGESAVGRVREIMGATDPAKAQKDSIRGFYGESIERNSIHGSDSKESAERELALFFS